MIPQAPGVPQIAWVRGVCDAYVDCLRPQGPPIDVGIARREHAAYVGALRGVGVEVRFLPDAQALPDAVFVEDVAIVIAPEVTVLTRPGVRSRIAEVETLETMLSGEVARLPEGATLEGGDVLRWGDTLSGLAKRYGVSVGALRRANGFSEGSTLRAGDSVKIPG